MHNTYRGVEIHKAYNGTQRRTVQPQIKVALFPFRRAFCILSCKTTGCMHDSPSLLHKYPSTTAAPSMRIQQCSGILQTTQENLLYFGEFFIRDRMCLTEQNIQKCGTWTIKTTGCYIVQLLPRCWPYHTGFSIQLTQLSTTYSTRINYSNSSVLTSKNILVLFSLFLYKYWSFVSQIFGQLILDCQWSNIPTRNDDLKPLQQWRREWRGKWHISGNNNRIIWYIWT